MANSPLVSIRIPSETLERIDRLAQELYPSRRAGKSPNRSQVILDAIEQFLKKHESGYASTPKIDEQINQAFQEYSKSLEPQIKEYIDNKFLAYTYNLERRLHALERRLSPDRNRSTKEGSKLSYQIPNVTP